MGRLDTEFNNMFREKEEVNRPDCVSDEDFVPAKEVEPSKPEDILIHVEL